MKSTNTYGDEITYNHICQGKPKPDKNKDEKRQLLQTFTTLDTYYRQNDIKKIIYHLINQVLEIETNAGVVNNTSIAQLPTNIQPVVTGYFVDNNNTSLSQQQLSSMINQLQQEINNTGNPNKTNYLPYILGGVGIVAVIIGLVWLVNRNKRENS